MLSIRLVLTVVEGVRGETLRDCLLTVVVGRRSDGQHGREESRLHVSGCLALHRLVSKLGLAEFAAVVEEVRLLVLHGDLILQKVGVRCVKFLLNLGVDFDLLAALDGQDFVFGRDAVEARSANGCEMLWRLVGRVALGISSLAILRQLGLEEIIEPVLCDDLLFEI